MSFGRQSPAATKEAVQAELGDVLFAVVNLARHLDVDAEQALAGANKRFEQRVPGYWRQVSAQTIRRLKSLASTRWSGAGRPPRKLSQARS